MLIVECGQNVCMLDCFIDSGLYISPVVRENMLDSEKHTKQFFQQDM
jgi:hypothetical protein